MRVPVRSRHATRRMVLAGTDSRPVALVHGDSHYFRVDKPFTDPATGRVLARITRAETFGDPDGHWLSMRVDPEDPDVFSFAPVLVPGNVAGETDLTNRGARP